MSSGASGSDDNRRDDYEVGYGKPPLATRFGAGNRGNPGNRKGRVRGTRNLKTDLLDELGETITLTEGARPIKISKQRALVKALVVKGIKGDTRALDSALNLLLRLTGADAPENTVGLSHADQAILDDLISRKGEAGRE